MSCTLKKKDLKINYNPNYNNLLISDQNMGFVMVLMKDDPMVEVEKFDLSSWHSDSKYVAFEHGLVRDSSKSMKWIDLPIGDSDFKIDMRLSLFRELSKLSSLPLEQKEVVEDFIHNNKELIASGEIRGEDVKAIIAISGG